MSPMKDAITPLMSRPNLNWRNVNSFNGKSIRDLINKYGIDILYESDNSGLFPIHWAAINGKSEIVDVIIKAGVPPTMKAKIFDEPEPIHFAAIEGNIEVIDLLLSYGVNVNVEDNSCCTPLMRAAMFGSSRPTKSSETVLHLISCGSDLNKRDINGLNCLHYAVLQNNEETAKLLINMGLNPNIKDNKGLKCIDYAMKRGNENLLKLLAPLTDGLSETHLQIALDKFKKKTCQQTIDEILKLLTQIFVIVAVLSALLWAYPQYIINYLPQSLNLLPLHIFFLVINIVFWISWYRTCTTNPGYLPINTYEYQQILEKKVELGKLHEYPNTRINSRINSSSDQRLCHSCKTVQTHRSKHCRFCKKCIARFDHHCIYLSTCIGHNNRISFFALTFSLFLIGILGSLLIIIIAKRDDTLYSTYNWLNLCYCMKFVIIGGILTSCTLRRAAINLTQNEEIKCWRYGYFKNEDGKFHNPFDKGSYYLNCLDFFRYKPYYYFKTNRFDY